MRSAGATLSRNSELFQLPERPTVCWHQISIEDDVREVQHVTGLRTIHEHVDAARMVMSKQEMSGGVFGRLGQVEGQMTGLKSIKNEWITTQTKSFQTRFTTRLGEGKHGNDEKSSHKCG